MDIQATLEYGGRKYRVFPKEGDELGAGSIKDLSADFAKDIVSSLDLMEESDEYENALWIIQEALYDFVKYDVLNFLADKRKLPPPKIKLEFPPMRKETEIWQTS